MAALIRGYPSEKGMEMATPKILITNRIADCGNELLKKYGFQVVHSETNLIPDVRKLIGDCDGIIARMTHVKAELIDAAPNLKIIGMHGVGLDHIDVKLASERGIAVTYAPESHEISVSEYIATMMMCLARHVPAADHALRVENRFMDRDKFVGHDVKGKTLGIIGLSSTGRHLAQIAGCGFGMKVIASDPLVGAEEMSRIANGVEKKDCIDDILRESDFVVLLCPLTPDTVGMIDYEKLKLMKPSAYLINNSRGVIVNEYDLGRALKEGIIAGAAVDEYTQEPTPDGFELFHAPNLIATPHIGASTYESMDRTIITLVEDFARFFFKHEKPKFLANPEIWNTNRGLK